jgi:hypothetical protein
LIVPSLLKMPTAIGTILQPSTHRLRAQRGALLHAVEHLRRRRRALVLHGISIGVRVGRRLLLCSEGALLLLREHIAATASRPAVRVLVSSDAHAAVCFDALEDPLLLLR